MAKYVHISTIWEHVVKPISEIHWDTVCCLPSQRIGIQWRTKGCVNLFDDVWRTASVAITLRVRELHVVVIFDLACWSANPPGPGRRCDMDGSQRGLGATYWVLSLPKLMQSSSLFLQEVWFLQVFPMFLTTCFLYLLSCSGLWICLKRCGMLRAPPHHVPGILGQFWDGSGRLGTAWKAWDGFRKSVGPCRTKQVKNIENSARYQVLLQYA